MILGKPFCFNDIGKVKNYYEIPLRPAKTNKRKNRPILPLAYTLIINIIN